MSFLFRLFIYTKKTIQEALHEREKYISWLITIPIVVFLIRFYKRLQIDNSDFFIELCALFLSISLILFVLFRYLLPLVLYLTGKIWKGKASFKEVQILVALIFSTDVFSLIYESVDLATQTAAYLKFFIYVIQVLIVFRISIIGLSIIQKFSYTYAVLNLFFPMLILSILYISING